MSKGDVQQKKLDYATKLIRLLDEYQTIILVTADNVGSQQMHQVRRAIRGESVLLMGKNTMIRKIMRSQLSKFPTLEALMPYIHGNVGIVFTKGEPREVGHQLTSNRVAAPAKAGAIAPIDVWVPAGNTGMGPEKTSFFQAIGIATKITKGTVEIINTVHLLKKGEKVGLSEATLLTTLKIFPFSYGLALKTVYDQGQVFDPEVLNITESDIDVVAYEQIRRVAAISMALNIPTLASAPHWLIKGYTNVVAVSVATDYVFPQVEQLKKMLDNPAAFAVATAAPTTAAAPAAKKAAVVVEEEEDQDLGFGLFD
jgi:large subunit ribosomal protein LP0